MLFVGHVLRNCDCGSAWSFAQYGAIITNQNSWRVAIQKYHGYPMWDFTSPTGFYETPHGWDENYSNKRPIPLPDPPAPYLLPLETQRVFSSGNQREPLLGKQRVSEESRTDFSFIPNALVLQTNNGHISKWDQARKSELTRILMSKSIRYCYQDTSYADPDKGMSVNQSGVVGLAQAQCVRGQMRGMR
jgi:hypothetical protein